MMSLGNSLIKFASVFWFTGMSGVGKSTISEAVKSRLELIGIHVLILDGDYVRSELNKNLGFSKPDIKENNRLVSELCVKHQREFDVIFVPIISPLIDSRNAAKERIGNKFYEIFVYADLNTLQKRDTKGFYKKAIKGQMNDLIGVSKTNKYEAPKNPDLFINTVIYTEKESIDYFYNFVLNKI